MLNTNLLQIHPTHHDKRRVDSPLVPLWYPLLVEGEDVPPLEQEQQRASHELTLSSMIAALIDRPTILPFDLNVSSSQSKTSFNSRALPPSMNATPLRPLEIVCNPLTLICLAIQLFIPMNLHVLQYLITLP